MKETREARGASLEDVADATRIAPRHLAALERSDLEALPAGPFAKGYIEGYAQFLGIDPEPILEAYRTEGRRRGLGTPEARDRIIDDLSRMMEQRERAAGPSGLVRRRLGLGLLVLLALGSLGYGGWRLVGSGASPGTVEPSTPALPGSPPPIEEGPALPLLETPPPPAPLAPVAEPASPGATEGLEVSRSGVGTGIEDLELVGRGDRFAEGTRVVFWTQVLGGAPDDVVHHVWIHEGEVVTRAAREIGSPSWRTHSTHVLDPGLTGRWVVEARGPDGGLLARHEFLCVSAEEPREGGPLQR